MGAETALLREIEDFCRHSGIAESTFGKRAVNDGKFVNRLRAGKGATLATAERVRRYIDDLGAEDLGATAHKTAPGFPAGTGAWAAGAGSDVRTGGAPAPPAAAVAAPKHKVDFRFYDNRQTYLMFVNTCSEKPTVAERVGMELAHIKPSPPALRVFDAGMGDGSVLTSVMRQMHRRFPTLPFYIVGKEISLEDVRLSLDKMADRFYEHPATVLVITNLYYTEAPWLSPRSTEAAAALNWIDVPLGGATSHEFGEQIAELRTTLEDGWRVRSSEKTGNPLYVRPSVLVLYRDDHRFLLDPVIPRAGKVKADFDMVIASQPYRARMPIEFKAERVIAPLATSLAPGGRLLGIHSYGQDPGLEIIQKIWPGEDPFKNNNRHLLMQELKKALKRTQRDFSFNTYADGRSIFRYEMHTLPDEISGSNIGTSTLMAAWNAAIYVAQIEDSRLESVILDGSYLDITREVLNKYGGLWFLDESFVVTRRRD